MIYCILESNSEILEAFYFVIVVLFIANMSYKTVMNMDIEAVEKSSVSVEMSLLLLLLLCLQCSYRSSMRAVTA